jgi:hypothetical protein
MKIAENLRESKFPETFFATAAASISPPATRKGVLEGDGFTKGLTGEQAWAPMREPVGMRMRRPLCDIEAPLSAL